MSGKSRETRIIEGKSKGSIQERRKRESSFLSETKRYRRTEISIISIGETWSDSEGQQRKSVFTFPDLRRGNPRFP